MRETDFIGQNKEKWKGFEKILKEEKKDAENLSRVFIETTDDLSFSRTYYPNRSVRVYLNGIAQRIYQKIYRNRKDENGSFRRFWTESLPDAVWFARRAFLVSFLVFLFGFLIGILSSAQNPEFVEIILGERYVRMTENNIENGDPMAVYGGEGHLETFLYIAWNNIQVGLLCFVMGLLFEIGTIFIVLSNAIMVGAFIWFFVERDLFRESFFAIMLHGTLELSMIVLAGAAGLVLGKGLVFPGSYSRLQAFLLSARHGLQIMIGVSAFLLVAALIEGFATRYTDAPDFIRGLIILLSLAIVLGYFVWYPWRRYISGKNKTEVEKETIDESDSPIAFDAIKSAGRILNESWRIYLKANGKFVAAAIGVSVVFTAVFYVLQRSDLLSFFDPWLFNSGGLIQDMLDGFWFWDEANNFFIYREHLWLYPLQIMLLSFVLWISLVTFRKRTAIPKEVSPGRWKMNYVNALAASILLLLPFLLNGIAPAIVAVVCVFWWPFWLFVMCAASANNQFLLSAIRSSSAIARSVFGRIVGAFLMQGIILWIVMSIVSAPLFFLIFQIIGSNFASSLLWVDDLIYLLHTFFMMLGLSALLPVLVITMQLLFFSNKEITTASFLKSRIGDIRFKQRAYGLEKER